MMRRVRVGFILLVRKFSIDRRLDYKVNKSSENGSTQGQPIQYDNRAIPLSWQKEQNHQDSHSGPQEGRIDGCQWSKIQFLVQVPWGRQVYLRLHSHQDRVQKIHHFVLPGSVLFHEQSEGSFWGVHQEKVSHAARTQKYTPPSNLDAKKKFLMLDLDETLIHSVFTSEKTDISFTIKGDEFKFNIRPYCFEFLEKMN